jgi:HAD superfamily hydrolase (TIGR01509 family)
VLSAVIFDMDGTLAETERDVHRLAFNLSFERLGLPDRWDEALYGELVSVAGGRERLRFYFDRYRRIRVDERLMTELCEIKNEESQRLLPRLVPRPGIVRLIDELHEENVTTAVATCGSRQVVGPLLTTLLGHDVAARFASIVTGEDVTRKKPDPEAYGLTLAKIGLTAGQTLVIEDSRNGLEAAGAAHLPSVVIPSFYSLGHDFRRADLVVDELGEPERSSRIRYNPHGIRVGAMVEVSTLRTLHHTVVGRRRKAAEYVTSSRRGRER